LEWFNVIRVHTRTRQSELRLLHRVGCLLKLHEARFRKARVDRVVFPAFASVVAMVLLNQTMLMLVVDTMLFVSTMLCVLSMALGLAHAHAFMVVWLDLLVFFG